MGNLEKEIQSKFKNEHVKALINIKYTSNWLDNIGAEILKPHNLSMQQYNVLRILRGAKKAITVNTVKDRMIQKSPNSTRLMDKLCEKNLIDRVRCENDRRVVYVKINENGLRLVEAVKIEEFDKYMEVLTTEEARELNRILDKIR